MTTTAIEFTEAEIEHRKSCAYLKGYVVAALHVGHPDWGNITPKRTKEFEDGWEDARGCTPNIVTLAHILHNRLRHSRPHRTSGKRHHDAGYTDFDQAHIDYMRNNSPYFLNKLVGKLATYGVDVISLMGVE